MSKKTTKKIPAEVAKEQPLKRAEQREVRSKKILEAAWDVYCEKGYDDVTIENIADRAGLSRMPIYNIFGDKQTVYFELANMFVEGMKKTMLGSLKKGAPLRRNLERLAKSTTEPPQVAARKLQSLFQVVHVISASRPDITEKQKVMAKGVIEDFAEIIRGSTLDKGEKLRAKPETIAALIVGLLNGLANVEFETGQQYAKASDLATMFMSAAIE